MLLLAGLVLLPLGYVLMLIGWPGPVRRWEEAISGSWAGRLTRLLLLAWAMYHLTVNGPPGRWWRAWATRRANAATASAATTNDATASDEPRG
jgi:hypothetical protein